MAFSLCQYIAERYYRRINYVVEKEIPILPEEGKKQFWSDLDLLAVGDDILLINCKDFLPSSKQRENIIDNLNKAVSLFRSIHPAVFKSIHPSR